MSLINLSLSVTLKESSLFPIFKEVGHWSGEWGEARHLNLGLSRICRISCIRGTIYEKFLDVIIILGIVHFYIEMVKEHIGH